MAVRLVVTGRSLPPLVLLAVLGSSACKNNAASTAQVATPDSASPNTAANATATPGGSTAPAHSSSAAAPGGPPATTAGTAPGVDPGTPATPVTQSPPDSTGPAAPSPPATNGGAAAATQLVFANLSLNQAIGACGALTVQLASSTGAPVTASSAMTLTLAATPGSGAFYLDNACLSRATLPATAAAFALSILTGNSAVTFYYMDPAIGTPALVASASGVTAAAQTAAITANPLTLSVDTVDQTGAGIACVGLTVGLSPAPTSALALTLTSSAGTGVFYSDSGCTSVATTLSLTPGIEQTALYFSDASSTTSDSVTVTPPTGSPLAAASAIVNALPQGTPIGQGWNRIKNISN